MMQIVEKKTDLSDEHQMVLDPVDPFELVFRNIRVEAQIQVDDPEGRGCCGRPAKKKAIKTIVKPCSGVFKPSTFTAIVGPSGCGKTTILNLLSGRLLSTNLQLYGQLEVNGRATDNVTAFKDKLGYVMQEDLLLPTFTPEEAFMFIANMRLPQKSQQQKEDLVARLIKSLGLTKCKDTYVGNYLIRGISGGEKKRTSIGVQLLINPSIIFMDEPTTGLDSTTSLNLIRLFNQFSKAGRTVISTIHQPSSQIFMEFDRLMLMVDGHIVYNNDAKKSIEYFQSINLQVPKNSNPLDYYMKLLNKQGVALLHLAKQGDYTEEQVDIQFKKNVEYLVQNFKKRQKAIVSTHSNQIRKSDQQSRISWCGQLCYIMKRVLINTVRNPNDLIAKVLQSIFFAVVTIILYERQSKTFQTYDQNLKGVVFFITMNLAFGAVFGSVNTFNLERGVFIRQRLSNTYDTTSYFVGRIIATFPGLLVAPIMLITISYFAVHLNNSAGVFFYTLLSGILIVWMNTAYGFLLSTLISDPVLVMALVPVLIIPLMLIGGFFTPLSQVHDFYRIFEYISVFKYGFQAMMQQQYINGAGFTNYPISQYPNRDPASILSTPQYNFDEPLWLSLFLMAAIGVVVNIFALIALFVLSNPKKMILKPAIQQEKMFSMNGGGSHSKILPEDLKDSRMKNQQGFISLRASKT